MNPSSLLSITIFNHFYFTIVLNSPFSPLFDASDLKIIKTPPRCKQILLQLCTIYCFCICCCCCSGVKEFVLTNNSESGLLYCYVAHIAGSCKTTSAQLNSIAGWLRRWYERNEAGAKFAIHRLQTRSSHAMQCNTKVGPRVSKGRKGNWDWNGEMSNSNSPVGSQCWIVGVVSGGRLKSGWGPGAHITRWATGLL